MIVTLTRRAVNYFLDFLSKLPPTSIYYPRYPVEEEPVPDVEPVDVVVTAKRSNKPRSSTLMKKTKVQIKDLASKKGIKLDARSSKEKMIESYLSQLDQE